MDIVGGISAFIDRIFGGKDNGLPSPTRTPARTYQYAQVTQGPQPPIRVMSGGQERLTPTPAVYRAAYTPPPAYAPPSFVQAFAPTYAAAVQPEQAQMIVRQPIAGYEPEPAYSVAGVYAGITDKVENVSLPRHRPDTGGGGNILTALGDMISGATTAVGDALSGAGSAIVAATEDPRLKLLAALKPSTEGTLEQRATGVIGQAALGGSMGLTGAAPDYGQPRTYNSLAEWQQFGTSADWYVSGTNVVSGATPVEQHSDPIPAWIGGDVAPPTPNIARPNSR